MQFKPFAVPQGFVFKDPDTGFPFEAQTKEALYKHIVSYRAQNRLPPIEQLPVVVENYWCSMPVNRMNCRPRAMEKGWALIFKKGVGLLKFLMFKKFVEQPVADARSEICVNCPLNTRPQGKHFYERWASKAAIEAVGERKSINHDRLLECQGCGCNMRAKVWTGQEIELHTDEVTFMRDSNPRCWQITSPLLKVIREEGPK